MPYEKRASFLSIGTFVHQIQFNINPEFVNKQKAGLDKSSPYSRGSIYRTLIKPFYQFNTKKRSLLVEMFHIGL